MTGSSRSVEFWEEIYRNRDRPSSGEANPILASIAVPLPAGRALDLGCGLGDDSNWLAERGWQVVGVDASATAVRRAADRATALGVADRVDFQQHDLALSFPDGEFDLVYALYLQSPVDFGRSQVLRRATRAVAPGGLLLVVVHGSIQPWSWNQDADTRFPTPDEAVAELELVPGEWHVVISGTPRRQATGPGGQTAWVTDVVTAVRRRAA